MNTSASTPSRTPAVLSAGLTLGGSGHADAINSCPKGATPKVDLRGYAVRLMKRCRRHGLRRCYCDGQCKDNDYKPDHSFLRWELMRSPGSGRTRASGALCAHGIGCVWAWGQCLSNAQTCSNANRSRCVQFTNGKRRVLRAPGRSRRPCIESLPRLFFDYLW